MAFRHANGMLAGTESCENGEKNRYVSMTPIRVSPLARYTGLKDDSNGTAYDGLNPGYGSLERPIEDRAGSIFMHAEAVQYKIQD